MNDITQFVFLLKDWVWSAPLLMGLMGVGLYLTWILRGIQFTRLWEGLWLSVESDTKSAGDINRFQALTTQLAGAIGTGTVVGMVTAISLGGVGALFWMWITAILGMATKYAESILAVRYRVKDHRGEMCGGPMYYMHHGLGWKTCALLFALFGVLAAIGTGNLVQVNSVADVLRDVAGVNPWITGVILAVVTGLVLMGGVKSIGRVTGLLVPVMAFFYLGGALVILFIHVAQLPSAFALIVKSAFTGQAALGGFTGSTFAMALQLGVSRGVFTNESGLGISSIASAAAKTPDAGTQGLVSMISTFVSTIVVCTATGLVLIVTDSLGLVDAQGQLVNGAPVAVRAFESTIWGGGWIVSIGLILFAYSTVLGWAYYGEKCLEYLLGESWVTGYRLLFSLLVIPGCALDLDVVWALADALNGLMAIPNLIALVALSSVVVAETKKHFQSQ